eukprot:symbB.v1.2.034483.t1/scaffold4460.1/size39461/2
MATRVGVTAGLTEASVRELVASAQQDHRPLPFALFEARSEDDSGWRSLACLLRCRAGGFMVVFPFLETIVSYLENWVDLEGSPMVLTSVVEVELETSRGRTFGTGSVLLADFSWDHLAFFRRPPTSRSSDLTDILRFKQQNTVLRPKASAVWEAAEQWINAQSSEETHFQEYVTAAEEDDAEENQEELGRQSAFGGVDQTEQADIIQQMQARLLELESRNLTAQSKAPPAAPSRNLFSQPPTGNLDTATWARLQAAAGQPPPRLGRFEAGTRAGQPRVPIAQDNFLEAEVEAEAIDKDEFATLAASMTDPMQKLMALQLKQNQDLLARIMPKSQDSITSALSGLANEGGNSSTGVRGCSAREAFIKQMDDHSMVARCVLQNAMKDMGVATPYPGLMRDYLERELVQQVICTLNWEALGHVVKPPSAACAGFCISPDQHLMIERIESMVLRFATAGSFEACQELPGETRDVDLLDVVNSVQQGLDPYGSNSSSKTPKNDEAFCPEVQHTDGTTFDPDSASVACDSKIHLDSSTCKPVVADRIKWEHSPSFDPRPFLTDPIVKAAYDNPETLRLPPECWIKQPRGKVHCNRKEVLKLAKKWDEKGALRIFPTSEVNHDEAVGIFAVGKGATWDRLILNPVVINGRMKAYSNYTKSLAPGCLIGLVQLAESEVLRISADDLAEMYYTFMVPDARARRNSLRMKFEPRELQGLSAFNPAKHTTSCYLALGALAMGDSLAVEIAQQAHFQVLVQLAGSLRDSERVAYRRPFPRGKFFEFLAIDDHLGLQVVSKSDFASGVRARDTEVFERAGDAYRRVGLVQHPKKKKRGVTTGTFLGAEVDGVEGKVSAPRHRTGLLMLCTSIVAVKGFATPKLLQTIVGSWVSILMFRRPIMAVMQAVFSEGSGRKPDVIFKLSRQARNELLALSILGPMAQTDLRTCICPKIFCMDASPHGSGICQVDEDEKVVAELWRHSEQRGFYTRLSNPAASILEEHGLSSEPVFGADVEPVHTFVNYPPPRSLREGFIFDCIELFKGEGNWSIAHSSVHLKIHAGLDVHGRRVAYVDMMDSAVFAELTSLAYRGVIREWHAGPPCFTFGTLRRPRIRSKARPWGFNCKDPLTIEQNSLARRSAFLLTIAILQGCFISVEQPGSSVMFYMHAFKVLAMLGGLHVESGKNRSDGPSRNRPVPAPSKETPGWLTALRRGNYDPFDAVLSSAFFARGPGRWVRFLILLCGDVERNPGPFPDTMKGRHDRMPRGPLDSTVGFATATASRMDHCLHAFRMWIGEHLQTTFEDLAENPHTMALGLRGYGHFLYEHGYPRYLLVYAITAVQDRLPHFRGFMAPAWQVDRKWQLAEPGECRPVISGPILCAAISVAAMWGWHFWIGVSMIGFLGMLHPAEFLNLCRQDLVLPKDALVNQQIAYVHLRNPKTARFARRQHAKIDDPFAVRYLEALYGSRPLSFRLFPGSVTVYRRQWDAIMHRLEVPHSRQSRGATPASLRGSGATHLYLATEDIQLIAWRGRWTKVKTIEFYLQEVAAQLILHHLSDSAKARIELLATFATSLLESAMGSFQWNTPSK